MAAHQQFRGGGGGGQPPEGSTRVRAACSAREPPSKRKCGSHSAPVLHLLILSTVATSWELASVPQQILQELFWPPFALTAPLPRATSLWHLHLAMGQRRVIHVPVLADASTRRGPQSPSPSSPGLLFSLDESFEEDLSFSAVASAVAEIKKKLGGLLGPQDALGSAVRERTLLARRQPARPVTAGQPVQPWPHSCLPSSPALGPGGVAAVLVWDRSSAG